MHLKYDSSKPGLEVLLDGAHNGQAALELHKYLKQKYNEEPITFIIAVTKGKDLTPLLSSLISPKDKIIVTKFGSVENMPWIKANEPHDLKQELLKYTQNVVIEPEVKKTFGLVEQGGNTVVCGSLYLVSEVLRLHNDNT